MDRLATRTIAGKLPSEGGVGAGKLPVEVVAEPIEVDIGADRHRYSLRSNLLSCGYYLSHNGSQRVLRTRAGRVPRIVGTNGAAEAFRCAQSSQLVRGTRPVVCHRRIVCNR